jgi:hypothetical protein
MRLTRAHHHRAVSFMPCRTMDAQGNVIKRWIVGICKCGAQRRDGRWK